MQDKVFFDTNLWIYLFLTSSLKNEDRKKRKLVKTLITNHPNIVVSNQVLNEISNVLLKKYQIDHSRVEIYLKKLLNIVELHLLDELNTFDALTLISQYNLSFYDALIVSAAIDANCSVLFSEDMQDGLKIEDKLEIVNPF
ncbi:MAG: PIN domain-containing protein [Pseudomonadota bacterium]